MSGIACSAGDAAAYVLGALDADEIAPFQDHLETCAICRDEVVALQVVVDMLPSAVPPIAAPRGLRKRVLGAVYEEAELFAAATGKADRTGWAGLRKARRTSRRPLVRPLSVLGAVGLLAVGVLVGSIGLGGLGSSGPSTRVIQAAVPSTAALTTAELRVRGAQGELVVSGMAPPPTGQVYEVWLQRGAQTDRTSALFVPSTNGSAEVEIPGNLNGVSTVMVTAEPAGGTAQPTTAPVIRAALD
jgi:anti-sigma-K factor RskA